MKNKKIIPFILVWIFAFGIGSYFRLYPLINFVPDGNKEKATMMVIGRMRQQIAQNIARNSPQLSPQEKQLLAKKQFDSTFHNERENVKRSIEKVAQTLSNNTPPKKTKPYLLASDSFYYYGLTENILKTGHLSDTIIGSKYLHKQMLAPKGHLEPLNLHPFVGFTIYKFIKFFNPSIDLMFAISFTPIVVTALSLTAFLLICYLFKIHYLLSFVGSVFFLLAPIFVKRSTFGWYDNDPYNTFFPFILLWMFFLIFQKHQNSRPKKGCVFFLSLGMMIYTLFWQGWMMFYSTLALSSLLILIHNRFILKRKKSSKSLALNLGAFLGLSFIFISLLFGVREFFNLFKEGWVALKEFIAPQLAIWPDIYLSVGELKSADLTFIIEQTGGLFFNVIGLCGILGIFIKYRNKQHSYMFKSAITLTVFLSFAFLITKGAQRFVLLCLIPLSLGFPIGLQMIKDGLTPVFSFIKTKNKFLGYLSQLLGFALILLIVLIPIRSIHAAMPSLLNPIYNQTWEKALTQIETKTPPESIINTWWSPGHFVKAIAKRRVSFDGATINFPQAYWISNILLNTDERESLGMLRMLNNSANDAVEYLHSLGIPISQSVTIVKEIGKLSKLKAGLQLTKILKNEDINHLLDLTHTNPPPSYILLYNEFVDNNIQLRFIGNWDFKRVEAINKSPELIAQVPQRNSQKYIDFLWELAGGPHKYSKPLGLINTNKDTLKFQQNVTLNLKSMQCTINSPEYGTGIPKSIFYLENDQIKEHIFPNRTLSYSVIYIEDDQKRVILLDRYLAQSLIVQLFFFDAKGLKYFKPFLSESDLTRRTEIKVFEVDWKSFKEDLNHP